MRIWPAFALILAGCVTDQAPRTFAKGSSEHRDDSTCKGHVKNGGPSTYQECRRDLIEASEMFGNMGGVAPSPTTIIIVR